MPGRRSSPHGKASCTTTERGTNGALSRWSCTPSRPSAEPKTAGSSRKSPSIARAYGSTSSLLGLKRSPRAGVERARRRGSRSAARARPAAGSRARRGGSTPRSGTRVSRPCSSNRQTSTASAPGENSATFVPSPSQVAPERRRAPGPRTRGCTGPTSPERSAVAPRPAGGRSAASRSARRRAALQQDERPAPPLRRSSMRVHDEGVAQQGGELLGLRQQPAVPAAARPRRAARRRRRRARPGGISWSSSPQTNSTGRPRATRPRPASASDAVSATRAVRASVSGLRSRFGRRSRSTDGAVRGELARVELAERCRAAQRSQDASTRPVARPGAPPTELTSVSERTRSGRSAASCSATPPPKEWPATNDRRRRRSSTSSSRPTRRGVAGQVDRRAAAGRRCRRSPAGTGATTRTPAAVEPQRRRRRSCAATGPSRAGTAAASPSPGLQHPHPAPSTSTVRQAGGLGSWRCDRRHGARVEHLLR